MKSLITAISISAVIVFFGIYSSHKIDNLSDSLITQNSLITDSINNLDYENAKNHLVKIRQTVSKNEIFLSFCMDHAELDKINSKIAELDTYISEEEKAMALSCTNALSLLFSHLPKDYHIKLENIF